MTTTTGILANPTEGSGSISPTSLRQLGIGLSLVALGGAMIAFAGALGAARITADAGPASDAATIGLWTFGLTAAAFGTAKFGIASVPLAIIRRITARTESVKFALPQLKAAATDQPPVLGEHNTPFGAAVATDRAPAPLLIHRFAGLMWLPMLAMAAMALYSGFALSLIAAGNVATDPQLATSQRAWVQGLQFLGEGLVLSGISFLLARILGAIRSSGGDVQASLGLTVHTLRMPATAKVFIVLMMAGLMVEIAQLFGYGYVAGPRRRGGHPSPPPDMSSPMPSGDRRHRRVRTRPEGARPQAVTGARRPSPRRPAGSPVERADSSSADRRRRMGGRRS